MDTVPMDYVKTDLGQIQIAPEVIEIISGLAAQEVEGISNATGSFGGISELLGRKNYTRGIRVELGSQEVTVSLSVSLQYGYRIPEVATMLQKNVKKAIETMTGLHVLNVNVHILEVEFNNEVTPQQVDRVK